MNLKKLLQIGIDRKVVLAYQTIFKTKEGQKVLLDLITRFHVLSSCQDKEQEGQRRTVLHILAMLGVKASDIPSFAEKMIEQ